MKINFIKTAILAVGVSVASLSCSDDFVDTKFYQDVEQAPLKSLTEVESFERGMYTSMRASTYYGRDYGLYAEVRSDEMYSNGYAGYYNTVYNYTMTSADAYARDTYSQIYTAVGKANILINTDVNGIEGNASQKDAVRYHIGQAYALRAMFFFDLLKLYGQKYAGGNLGIVTPLKYDPKAMQARGTVAENEAQIEADFVKGLNMMQTYDISTTDPTFLGVNAVKALMSRFYLYKKDYAKVRSLVSQIADSYQVMPAASYVGSWSSTKQNNSIFELAVGVPGSNGTDSWGYMLNYNGYGNVVMSPSVYNSFSNTDVRKKIISETDGEYYLYKYPNLEGTDNIKIVRIEEVLLNGVEAELNGGSTSKATEYYHRILSNRLTNEVDAAGNIVSTVQQQINNLPQIDMSILKQERAKELVGEGLRLWDLLRWGDPVPRPAGVSTNIQLNAFPIPRTETDIAGTLIVSNPGYDN